MTIVRLDHVNVTTNQLEEMVAWYAEVLGLTSGPRPAFPFPGAWLYAGEHAVVHLVGHDKEPGSGSEAALKLEHFAFSATDMDAFETSLNNRGQTFEKIGVPGTNLTQFHIADPDGNHIHIDFEADE